MPKKMQNHFVRIIHALNNGQYHDGNSIGKQLQLSRSAVWKAMQKIRKYGIQVDAIKGKGYAFLEPFILLDRKKIKKNLGFPVKLDIFESVSSTNEYLKLLKNVTVPHICIAEHQTHGKGRLDRPWHSPFGKNIYLSCRFPFKKEVSELAGLSLVTALSVFKTIRQYEVRDSLFLKWPNDVYYDHKKISGILLEVQSESHDGISHAIIGVGINVNSPHTDEEVIAQPWTSMRSILHQSVDRNAVAADLINCLMTDLLQFDQNGFLPFIREWQQHDYLLNKNITLKNINHQWTGRVQGINEYGQMLLELPNGEVKAFSSGNVTVMK